MNLCGVARRVVVRTLPVRKSVRRARRDESIPNDTVGLLLPDGGTEEKHRMRSGSFEVQATGKHNKRS